MMQKLATFIFTVIVSFYCVSGQSVADFKKAFGKPVGRFLVFNVSKNILMKPDFDKNGQVCRAGLVINGVSPDLKALTRALPFEDFHSVVDRVIPVDKRGAKHEPFGG